MTEFVNKQYDAVIRIEKIKQALGARMLDGEPYDVAELIDAEAELEIAYSAEGEQKRRALEGAEALVQRRRQEVRAEIAGLVKERAEAIQMADAACAMLTEALEILFGHNDKIERKIRSLGLRPPAGIGPHDGRHRVSYRIARSLVKAVGSGHFGAIEIRNSGGGHYLPDGSDPNDSWLAADRKLNNFKAAMKGNEQRNGGNLDTAGR